MSVGEFLLDVVVEFVLHGFGAVLEWLGGCFRRAGAIFFGHARHIFGAND